MIGRSINQVLVLPAMSGADRLRLRESQDRLLLGLADLLPSGFGLACKRKDSFQRRESISVVIDGPGQSREHVRFGISMQQYQYLRCLVFSAALLRQQPFQEAQARFAKLGESLAQTPHLLFVIFRRRMRGVHDRLHRVALNQTMLGDG